MEMDERSDGRIELSRRELLTAGVAAGVVIAAPTLNRAALAREKRLPMARGDFAHGVASGFPHPRAITLWTRVSGLDRSARLTLEIARDRQFRKVVRRRQVVADSRRDFTVHARVAKLDPGRQYFYRFETRSSQSPVGRFRTLPPPDSRQPVRIAFFSCQSYEMGYYTAHAGLAQEKDLDLVLCLGDYIYESHYEDGPPERADRTGENGDGDAQTLDDFRQKYRLYQSDPNLQAMHAAHPFVSIWDDHEVENNFTGDRGSAALHDPTLDRNGNLRRVSLDQRRGNAYRAFFEAMPRMRHKRDRDGIYGSMRLGRTAELFLTDQRRFRDRQPCEAQLFSTCGDYDTVGRTMLGPGQKRWIKEAISTSDAKWKLWGSQVMMMALQLPATQPVNPDQWDGYSAERAEILGHLKSAKVKNLAVLSGDIHTFFAGDLTTTGDSRGEKVGIELVGGSTTSFGISEAVGIKPEVLDALVPENDPHIGFSDFAHHGYGVVTARRDKLIGELKAAESTFTPTSPVSTIARFEVAPGIPELVRV